jgi:hypothetical protein
VPAADRHKSGSYNTKNKHFSSDQLRAAPHRRAFIGSLRNQQLQCHEGFECLSSPERATQVASHVQDTWQQCHTKANGARVGGGDRLLQVLQACWPCSCKLPSIEISACKCRHIRQTTGVTACGNLAVSTPAHCLLLAWHGPRVLGFCPGHMSAACNGQTYITLHVWVDPPPLGHSNIPVLPDNCAFHNAISCPHQFLLFLQASKVSWRC